MQNDRLNSNPNYLSKKQYVLRKKPAGALLSATAHAVEREYRVLNALGTSSDVPVPKVYVLCEDSKVIGTPFYVRYYFVGVYEVLYPVASDKNCRSWSLSAVAFSPMFACFPCHMRREDNGMSDFRAS